MGMVSLSDLTTDKEFEEAASVAAGEIFIAKIDAIDERACPLVTLAGVAGFKCRPAISTIKVVPQDIGREVALMFTQGDSAQPLIIGFIHTPISQVLDIVLATTESHQENGDISVFDDNTYIKHQENKIQSSSETLHVDGKRIVLEGKEEIVLRCGDSCITLQANGKISIKGKYVLSRSSGVNRILGGSVQVN